ncbi:rubrerythrin [Desulfocucumis palustris]|uniref:Rubrerythrin n=1 Tax=Desulfocucumis palustris TaxID=1898651 RepID=A0A2L2XFC9_9FIRM|nr:ferritin family protein [Desulfocucumis palustris]GBF34948.1 rubrerythrin [Desulfocucumis palustris]
MEHDFSLQDIVSMAMENEEKGHRFYSHMSLKVKNQATRDIFHKLALEEIEHKKSFQKLLGMELSGQKEDALDGATKKYLKAIILADVFPEIDESRGGGNDCDTPLWALGIGIQAEKNSILVYQEMYNKIQFQPARDLFSKLLEEEKMHLVELREQVEELSK